MEEGGELCYQGCRQFVKQTYRNCSSGVQLGRQRSGDRAVMSGDLIRKLGDRFIFCVLAMAMTYRYRHDEHYLSGTGA